MSFQTRETHLRNTLKYFFYINWNFPHTQKCRKYIVKIVHVASVVQPQFYKATRIHFVRKQNKNNDFIQQFFSFKSRTPPL